MKKSLLQILVCAVCSGRLSGDWFEEASGSDEITSGVLTCVCGTSYPVIGGIPRLLPPTLQSMMWKMHPQFFRTYRDRLPAELQPEQGNVKPVKGESAKELTTQRDTADSFGYEWQVFSEILPDYEENFRWYFEGFTPSSLSGKRVLDAGCGTGRHTFHMARESDAREIIAVNLSQAIEVAARNNQKHANTHFVQADIYHLPFLPGSFDFIYSLGVLHHLPDPERGFRDLLRLLRDGCFINIYLYWNLEGEPSWRRALLAAVTKMRRVTTRLPHPLLQRFAWLAAAGLQISFVAPARALDKFNATRPLADRVPLGHYRKYSFRVLYTDQFDRFSAPIENRYAQAEVAEWFARAGLEDVVILGGAGWRASGRRAIGAQADEARTPEESLLRAQAAHSR